MTSEFFERIFPKPEGWTAVRPKQFAVERNQYSVFGEEELLSVSEYYGVAPRASQHSTDEHLTRAESLVGYRVVKLGDLVMNYMLAWKGAQGVSEYAGIVSPAYSVLKLDKRVVLPRFLHYLFRSDVFRAYFRSESTGIIESRLRLYPERLSGLRMMIPKLTEQALLSDFLDRETARIDALIEKKQRLIELLEEKRQAVITQAVTRGLDPDVLMKDSGVEWLGTVPEHWEVVKFSRVARIAAPQVDPAAKAFEELPLIAPNHVQIGSGVLLDLETASNQGASSGKYLCQPRDVIYSKIRPALRKATIAPSICLCSADMYPITCDAALIPEFMLIFLLSEPFSFWAVGESDRVAMPKINRESLTELRLPLPPIKEQREIVTRVQGEGSKLGALRLATEKSIVLLRERRSALITAAVTGQLDIRDAAA